MHTVSPKKIQYVLYVFCKCNSVPITWCYVTITTLPGSNPPFLHLPNDDDVEDCVLEMPANKQIYAPDATDTQSDSNMDTYQMLCN